MSARRILAGLGLTLILAGICAPVVICRPLLVRTSLDELVGEPGRAIPDAVKNVSSTIVSGDARAVIVAVVLFNTWIKTVGQMLRVR